MQTELDAEYPNLDIDILSINMIGAESGTGIAATMGSLPIVNDDNNTQVWANWGGAWRDLYILDRYNQVVTVYNLTLNNLSPGNGFCSDNINNTQTSCEAIGETWTENYDYLKELFISLATQ